MACQISSLWFATLLEHMLSITLYNPCLDTIVSVPRFSIYYQFHVQILELDYHASLIQQNDMLHKIQGFWLQTPPSINQAATISQRALSI